MDSDCQAIANEISMLVFSIMRTRSSIDRDVVSLEKTPSVEYLRQKLREFHATESEILDKIRKLRSRIEKVEKMDPNSLPLKYSPVDDNIVESEWLELRKLVDTREQEIQKTLDMRLELSAQFGVEENKLREYQDAFTHFDSV